MHHIFKWFQSGRRPPSPSQPPVMPIQSGRRPPSPPQSPVIPVGQLVPENLYALIIGINAYPDPNMLGWPSLSGAIADAESFRDFLVDTLKVPQSNIRLILDGKRAEIIATLKFLKQGELVMDPASSEPFCLPPGSAFVFYYAGHGGRSPIPERWKKHGYTTADGQVEQLVPSDIGTTIGDRKIVGIPDRVISVVLEGLIKKIGDNVTVILDCCHALGGTRAGQAIKLPVGSVVRALTQLPALPDDADEDIVSRGGRGISLSRAVRGGESNTDNAQYILLAACQQDQLAIEDYCGNQRRGVFTHALLKVLTPQPRMLNLTYAGVMLHMSLKSSLHTPACFGANQDRIVFTTINGESTKDLFVGRSFSDSSDTLVYGGLAHGITDKDTLLLYHIDAKRSLMGEAKIKECHAVCTTIIPSPLAEKCLGKRDCTFYCKAVPDCSQLSIYFDSSTVKDLPEEVCKLPTSKSKDSAIIVIAEAPKEDHVLLSFGRGTAGDYSALSEGLGHEFLAPVRKTNVMTYVEAMFRFRRLLGSNSSTGVDKWPRNVDTKDPIGIEFRSLGRNAVNRPSHLLASAATDHAYKIDIQVKKEHPYRTKNSLLEESTPYGLSLSNNTQVELFVYAICFSTGNLSILPWYSSSYFTPDVPLYEKMVPANDETEEYVEITVAGQVHRGDRLDIGAKSSGVKPYRFLLPRECDKDRTYFKVIITTTPADFTMFTQAPLDPSKMSDASINRATTCRSGYQGGQSRENALKDANELAHRFRLGELSKDYISMVLCIDQTGE